MIAEMWIFQIGGEMLAHPHEPYIQTAIALCDTPWIFGLGNHAPHVGVIMR